jgi:hypothetical protein
VQAITASGTDPISMVCSRRPQVLHLYTLRRKTTSSHSNPPPPIRPILIYPTPSPHAAVSSQPPTPSGCLPRNTSRREDNFNGALYSLKAFSIATALVVVGAAASLWGVKTYLGVKDVRKFAFFHPSLPIRALFVLVIPVTGIRICHAPNTPHKLAPTHLAHPSHV